MARFATKRVSLFVLFLSVILNASGQIFFKAARNVHPDASLFSLFLQADTWIGLMLYGLSSIGWLWVLSRSQLSFAYPVLSLSFPIVVGFSALLFSELIAPIHWIGVLLIVIGVSLLTST